VSEDWTPDRAFRAGEDRGIGQENWFAGATSLFRRRYAASARGADVAVLGVPFDQAVTNRPGARLGPRAIRAASSNLAWPGGPWRWPRDPLSDLAVVDTGDVAFDTGDPSSFADAAEARAAALIEEGVRILALGGDHFVTYPLLKALAARRGPLALVQFDSHSDTWREASPRLDHGTMFFRAIAEGLVDTRRSVQVGIRSRNEESHGVSVIDADAVDDRTPGAIAAEIRRIVGDGPAYLTFDIDFLDPSCAPGTGTPVCGGPSTAKAERILCALAGLNLIGADVVEVCPPYDHAEITALAAATMALHMIGLFAAARRG